MTCEMEKKTALIVTGEASGDIHGAHLIEESLRLDPDLRFIGVGGKKMAEAGCEIIISSDELAVVGLVEVISHFPQIKRAFNCLRDLLHGPSRPDLLVLIDFPDFNLRLAKEAKKAGIPVLYYVSPQVWAWRRGRVKKIAAVVDKLAAIFPFEPEFYKGLPIDVRYVGHPLLDEFKQPMSRDSYLAGLGIAPDTSVVGLFPGSRRSELKFNLETIIQAAQKLQESLPQVQFLVPMASNLDPRLLRDPFEASALPVHLVDNRIYDVAGACDAVLSVSGTVTLQTALAGTPMAIIYKMSPVTYAIGKRLVKVDHIGLANIVAGKSVVREFIQQDASPEALSQELHRLITDQDYSDAIRRELSLIQEKMGDSGCSERVARMALEMVRGGNG